MQSAADIPSAASLSHLPPVSHEESPPASPYADHKIIRRNGAVVAFEPGKISIALTKAFIAVNGGQAAASARIRELVENLTNNVVSALIRRQPNGGTFHIEDIQDQVELSLMRAGEHKIARDYVIYREEQARKRAAKQALSPATQAAAGNIKVIQLDGSSAPLDLDRIHTIVNEACVGLDDVSETRILDEALRNPYDGVTAAELSTSLVITARTMIEQEPNYTYVSARLLCDNLRAEALNFLGVATSATQSDMHTLYARALPAYITSGVELELLSLDLR